MERTRSQLTVLIPDCLFVLMTGILTAVPWLPWRFSIRTLLITTTLVAIGLGLMVWLAR